MIKLKLLGLFLMFMLASQFAVSADNEIYIDQSGTTANIDLEQLGTGNIIGGLDAVAGNMTPLDLDGTGMTLDINMIGNTNKFLGDIWADSYTGFFELDGDSNTFTMQTDPTNTYGADSSNVNVDVTGNSNTMTLNQATTALASQLDLDWIINGDSNTVTSSINYDGATNFMDIDGNSNSITFTGSGYAGGYFNWDHTGNNTALNIQQLSTQDNDWLKITSISNNTGSNTSTVCVVQNDQGTSTGC